MPDFKHAPIKRHEALAPFSRDHYNGLVHAQRLTKASDPASRRDALAHFLDGWDQEIAEHFADEERLLLDHLSESDRERLLSEHATLRGLAGQARELRREV